MVADALGDADALPKVAPAAAAVIEAPAVSSTVRRFAAASNWMMSSISSCELLIFIRGDEPRRAAFGTATATGSSAHAAGRLHKHKWRR